MTWLATTHISVYYFIICFLMLNRIILYIYRFNSILSYLFDLFFVYFLILFFNMWKCTCVCEWVGHLDPYLECGINNGEPIDGGGIVGVGRSAAVVTAAVSGWRKFRRWSTRSWCCVRHRVISSGSASNCSCNFQRLNWMSKNVYFLHFESVRLNDWMNMIQSDEPFKVMSNGNW